MAFKTLSTIRVKGNIHDAFEIIRDIKKWPDIFPPCKEVEIYEEKGNKTTFYLTAVTNGIRNRWFSEQEVIEKYQLIRFRQLEPSPPLLFMQGEWHLAQRGTEVKIEMTHEFDVKTVIFFRPILGFIIKKFFVDRNSNIELRALAEEIMKRKGA